MRIGLAVLLAAGPVVSAGLCQACESACQSDGRCCHRVTSANESGTSELPLSRQQLAAIENVAVDSSCCCTPMVVSATGACDAAGEADQQDQSRHASDAGCGCLLTPRHDTLATPTSSAEKLRDAPTAIVVVSLADETDASAPIASLLSAHLSHAPTRPLRVLYGVWRN